jgi:hypothetical protein
MLQRFDLVVLWGYLARDGDILHSERRRTFGMRKTRQQPNVHAVWRGSIVASCGYEPNTPYLFHTYIARVCSKYFMCFQFYIVANVFMLQVASVLFGYCIYCHGYTCMLQMCVLNVSTVLDVCCKCFV